MSYYYLSNLCADILRRCTHKTLECNLFSFSTDIRPAPRHNIIIITIIIIIIIVVIRILYTVGVCHVHSESAKVNQNKSKQNTHVSYIYIHAPWMRHNIPVYNKICTWRCAEWCAKHVHPLLFFFSYAVIQNLCFAIFK